MPTYTPTPPESRQLPAKLNESQIKSSSDRHFAYTPLLLPVRVSRGPRAKKITAKAKRELKIRTAIQQPLPLTSGKQQVVEYQLKPRPNPHAVTP